MKKMNIKKIALILSAISIGAFLIAGLLFVFGINSYGYLEKNIYEEKIHQIDNLDLILIKSPSFDVKILPVESDEIKITLTGRGKASSEEIFPRLTTKIIGDKLIIEVKPIRQFSIGFSFFSSNLKLEIYLPKSYKNNLDLVVSSADVVINDLAINNFNFSTSSGDLDLTSFKANRSIMRVSSGDIIAAGFNGDLEIVSSSGEAYIEYEKFNNNVTLRSSSGNITLKLPPESRFYLKADTSSGNIVTDFPIAIIGSIKEDYLEGTAGDSNNRIEIKTSSGDIELLINK
ncbi:MAG: DUF4097 domain-containing protein [Halanaerobiales bacterium]|nr:DUF4097 domain-containing protein [Halanaerobiales bacterium]